jgi:hypothetical protein
MLAASGAFSPAAAWKELSFSFDVAAKPPHQTNLKKGLVFVWRLAAWLPDAIQKPITRERNYESYDRSDSGDTGLWRR